MKTSILQSFKLTLLFMAAFLAFDKAQAQIVFTETYTSTQGNATAAQLANWNSFRAQLVPLPYSKMKVTGITGATILADSCLDPIIVQDIAMRLRTAVSGSPTYSWTDGTRIWRVGDCGTGPELSMNQNICACTNPGHSVRGGCTTCFNNNGSWGFADCGMPTTTFIVEFFYGYPCTSTPTANISGPYQVCANKPFTLVPDKFYADATYTWEYTDNAGATWLPWTGTVGAYTGGITDAISAPRSYRLTITCNANTTLTYKTNVWDVTLADFMYCYCDNFATISTGLDIGNVTVTDSSSNLVKLNNGSATPFLNNNNAKNTYTSFQYSVPAIPMYRDSTYQFSVTEINSAGTFKAGNVVIYIDFNRNGIFDAAEKVMSKQINTVSIVPNTETAFYKVPTTADYGLTGMRVILSSGPTDSCGLTGGEGEVEDYIVDLRYIPCNGAANAGTVTSSETSLCTGYDYVLTNSGYETKKSELERLWQVSADNIGWTNISASNNKNQLFYTFTGQPLYYRVRMICPRTNDTSYTPVLNVKAKDGYKCYCFSQAEGGKYYDSSDIGGISIAGFTKNSGGAHLMNPIATSKRTDYTDDTPVNMFVDSTYQITVYHTMRTSIHGDAKITVFMDFNNNKEYDVPYERVYTGYTSVGNFTLVDNINIPDAVITNVPTGMRVILNNNITPNNPSDLACGPYPSGETEDLMVMFQRHFPAGITSANGISNFGLFPNPSNGKFHIQFSTASNEAKDVLITITNVTGQQVQQYAFKHNGGQFAKDMDLTDKPSGVYFVEIKAGDEISKKKLVIK